MDVRYILTLSFLIYPLFGLFLGYLTRDKPKLRYGILVSITTISFITIIGGIFGISTIYTWVNFMLYSAVYLSLATIFWYIFFKHSKILAAFLILTLYCVGFIFSLALPLTSELVPKVSVRLSKDLLYKETPINSTFAGKRIEVYKVYGDFLEKRISSKEYQDIAPAFINDTLNVKYSPDHKKLYLSIPQKPDKYIYTFHKNFDPNWRDTISL